MAHSHILTSALIRTGYPSDLMELRILPAALIFIGSYLPLSIILLSQDFNTGMMSLPLCTKLFASPDQCIIPLQNPILSLGFFILCMTCFTATFVALKLKTPTQEIIIKDSKHIPTDLMNYVLPYIVSFMSIQYIETGKFIGFLLFLSWLFWLTYKSGQIILNPVLIAFGWKLYEIKYSFMGSTNELTAKALTKQDFVLNTTCKVETIQEILVRKE